MKHSIGGGKREGGEIAVLLRTRLRRMTVAGSGSFLEVSVWWSVSHVVFKKGRTERKREKSPVQFHCVAGASTIEH